MALGPKQLRKTDRARQDQADALEKEIDKVLPKEYKKLPAGALTISIDFEETREIHTEVQTEVCERYQEKGWEQACFHLTCSDRITGRAEVRFFTLRFPQ